MVGYTINIRPDSVNKEGKFNKCFSKKYKCMCLTRVYGSCNQRKQTVALEPCSSTDLRCLTAYP